MSIFLQLNVKTKRSNLSMKRLQEFLYCFMKIRLQMLHECRLFQDICTILYLPNLRLLDLPEDFCDTAPFDLSQYSSSPVVPSLFLLNPCQSLLFLTMQFQIMIPIYNSYYLKSDLLLSKHMDKF